MPETGIPDPEELREVSSKAFTRRVALTTAVFASVLALASLGGGKAKKEALLASQAATNLWTHAQAKTVREYTYYVQRRRAEVELDGAEMTEEARSDLQGLVDEFADAEQGFAEEKHALERKARTMEQERDRERTKDPYFEYAEVFLQISIVLASVAILTESRRFWYSSIAVAAVGALFTLDGFTLLVPLLRGPVEEMEAPEVRSSEEVATLPADTEDLVCHQFSDGDLASLSRFARLRKLSLHQCGVTDAGIAQVAKLASLEELDLGDCRDLTDAAITPLLSLQHLESLNLAGCGGITDAGIQKLAKAPRLRSVCLVHCAGVTDEGVKKLKAAKRGCAVDRAVERGGD